MVLSKKFWSKRLVLYSAQPWKQQLLKASQRIYGYLELIVIISCDQVNMALVGTQVDTINQKPSHV